MTEMCDAIIVAGGSGTRLGHKLPKAFVPLAGKPLLSYSVDVFRSHPAVSNTILVVPESMLEEAQHIFSPFKRIRCVTGGKERWMSVQNGVDASNAEWIMVHDAARPFVTIDVINHLLEKRFSYDSAITATPMVDTIRTFTGDLACATIDRTTLIRVGTPQLFRRSLLLEGFKLAASRKEEITDEAMLMQLLNKDVGLSWGDPINFKITTAADLEIAEALLRKK
jgi:2-C-methyl-D-erythritol 4-phosphate cytidylyltransferase